MNPKILDLIDNCPNEIKEHIITKKFEKNTKIIEQGFEVKYLYILLNGSNKIYRTSESGASYLQIIVEPEEIYGEIEVLNNKLSTCTVEALTDCEVLMLSKEIYRKWLQIDTDFSMFIIDKLSNKLYLKIIKASNDIFYSLEYKFISLILSLYYRKNSTKIYISKNLMAEELTASIRSINRIIHKLKQKNILMYCNGQILILDIEKLKQEKELLH
ncbi:Crp/Fnr family transcriptional regulator [Clostridium sp. DJ247]|uniref:Crp/Fnr family transcriptional regulator n=1 Tax=Clostridium sp. DJ247 TaxID=2726188 RepID=UPI001624421E|nr:Crp/Fnr family transcriptional regulator [Clostridium sp. DJ247]MBC2582317.1 Crp/Fnr family transcriptional regulator [Clostridium sp. DJ247]